ncbi:MAG: large-conductance mechanosensitive channel protein MscL [Desulfobacterales bacterium]
MLKEFKEFILKGNAMDMAVGIIIGAAFGTVVKSLVEDVIMPPIGLLLGNVDFSNLFIVIKEGAAAAPYASLKAAEEAGAITLNFGIFFNNIISLLIVGFAVFILVKNINRLQKEEPEEAPTTKDCPFCKSEIALEAVRCPHCTSEIPAA